jgi:hypothetical protein
VNVRAPEGSALAKAMSPMIVPTGTVATVAASAALL